MASDLDTQKVELIGRHWLIGELVPAGLSARQQAELVRMHATAFAFANAFKRKHGVPPGRFRKLTCPPGLHGGETDVHLAAGAATVGHDAL